MELRGLDIDDLILIVLIYEGFSISNAAVKLKITQPAASQRMKKVSVKLGFNVLEKNGVKRAITEKGKILALACRRALAILDGGVSTDEGSRAAEVC